MTQRIEKIERERERERAIERGGKGREVAKCGANKRQEKERKKGRKEREKKNRRLKGRITSGILVFAFHLDQSRFPDFPSFHRGESRHSN